MYPTLYHVFYDWLGLDWSWMKMLNSFGFFVALAFIAANYTLTLEIKRKEALGFIKGGVRKVIRGGAPNLTDIFTASLLFFIVGWKLIYLLVNASELFQDGASPQAIIFSSKGYFPLGILFAIGFAVYRYNKDKKTQLDKPIISEETFSATEYTGTITFLAAAGGFVGAKMFHLFENPDELKAFFAHPSLNGFIAGLTVYGGLIVGTVVVISWAKMKKIPLLVLSDAATPGMMLAYGIGRMGCHVSGDGDWGVVTSATKPSFLSWLPDWAWSYDYPNNVLNEGEPLVNGAFSDYGMHLVPGVFPTPLYEIFMAFIIFGILWYMRKKTDIPGIISGAYLIFNGIERFMIEKIRVNNVSTYLGMKMTQAEFISILFILAGAGLVGFLLYRRKKELTN